jgi:hypothetical protein
MTKKQLIYLWQYFLSGGGGIVASDLVMRPNFNDMANLSLTSPSNGSATFNGTSDYVRPSSFPITSADSFSVSAWFYSGGNSSTAVIFEGDISSPSLEGRDSGYTFYINNTAVGSTGTIAPNRWYFFTGTFDKTSGRRRLYLDGSLIASTTATASTTWGAFSIGARFVSGSSSFYFKGNIANVGVWNRELNTDEINSIQWKRYDLLTAGESTGLVAWYALDDITGTSVPDSTGTYNATAY